MSAATEYVGRLGDDGAAIFRTPSLAQAISWAIQESRRNWAGRAQILDGHGKVMQFKDGVATWTHPSLTGGCPMTPADRQRGRI